MIEGADGIEVCAVDPGKRGSRNSTCGHGDDDHDDWEDNDVVVDFTISVPPGVAFDGSTVNGGIDVSGLSSDVSVSTVNGGIEVASTGTVEAKTVNGSIDASTGAASWSGTLEFKTVNGSIHLSLPAGAAAAVSAQTLNGDFSLHFPLSGRFWWSNRPRCSACRASGRFRGAALECVHCYSLAHDDLPAMDDDDLRRGRASLHRAFDEATAILAGDALLTLAFEILCDTVFSFRCRRCTWQVVSKLAKAAGMAGMAGGQMLDGAWKPRPGSARSRDIVHMPKASKTGALFSFACEAGEATSSTRPIRRHLVSMRTV